MTSAIGVALMLILATISGTSKSVLVTADAEAYITAAAGEVTFVYESLAAHRMSERRQLFDTFSPQMKAALWRLQLEEYVRQHPDMSRDARRLVDETIALLGEPDLYLTENHTVARSTIGRTERSGVVASNAVRVRLIGERARLVFGPDLARALFAQLGPVSESIVMHDAADTCVLTQANGVRPLSPACTCTSTDDWCSGLFYHCVGGGCTWSRSGCGTLWQQYCNGLCKPYE